MAILRIIFSIVCLIMLISAQEIKTPLSVFNPLDVVQHNFASSGVYIREPLEFAKQFHSNVFEDYLSTLQSKNDSGNNACLHSFLVLKNDTLKKMPYSLQMLDSWAKPESGILNGNLRWFGLYYECESAQGIDFGGRYCQVYVGKPPQADIFGLGVEGVTMGLCFPDTCTKDYLQLTLSEYAAYVNLSVIVTCPTQYAKWEGKDIAGLILLVVLVLIVFASTLYDYIKSRLVDRPEYSDKTVLFNDALSVQAHELKHGTFHKIMTSFSIIQNTNRLLSTQQKPTDITCLHGLRFLSMSWVILGHSFLFSVSYSDNIKFTANYYLDHWDFQAVGNGFYSVDSFFYLSGLLVVYLGLRTLEKRNGKMNVPLMYLYRYLRLTPPYALLIFMLVSVYPKLGDGPSWSAVVEPLQSSCAKYWYSSLLYFNNLYPSDMQQECFGWGWYLANDTQFYLLSPIFLYLLYKSPMIGVISTSATLLASIVITGAFSSYTQQQSLSENFGLLASGLINPPVNATNATTPVDPSSFSPYMYDLYTKPWCRIGAYLVGMLTGYILHAHKDIKMPKIVVVIGWIVAAATNCALVYGLYPSFITGIPMDNNTAAFYNAVCRPLWCMGLAWLTIACVNGYGGPINSFLSWKVFMPLSRLTYCSYLVHPMIIWWFVATQEVLLHYSIPTIIMLFISSLVAANLFAYAVAMLIEFPVVELMKILQQSGNSAAPRYESHVSYSNGSSVLNDETDA